MLSDGLWDNVPDFDAPTQLVLGTEGGWADSYRGPIPRGIYAPICGMNLAWNIEALPYMYWCPCKELPGAERFDDIWMGINLTREFDELGWAIYSGGATCRHERASDVWWIGSSSRAR